MYFYFEKKQYRMFSLRQSSNKPARLNSHLLCNYTDLRADPTCALALKRVASRNTFE